LIHFSVRKSRSRKTVVPNLRFGSLYLKEFSLQVVFFEVLVLENNEKKENRKWQ